MKEENGLYSFTKHAVYYRTKQCSKSHWYWKWTAHDYLQRRRRTKEIVERADKKSEHDENITIAFCSYGLYEGNKQGMVQKNEEYLNYQPWDHLLLLFQARKYPELESTIGQQTSEWNVHSWPSEYEILGLDDYEVNVSIFWKWIVLNESFD